MGSFLNSIESNSTSVLPEKQCYLATLDFCVRISQIFRSICLISYIVSSETIVRENIAGMELKFHNCRE